MQPATTPCLSAARRKENKDKGLGDGNQEGTQEEVGRAEERQETREQRPEVKGEAGGEGWEGHVGPGVCKERQGRRGAEWRRGGTGAGNGKMRKPEYSFQVCGKAGKGRGRRPCQANRKTEGEEVC